MYYIVCPFLTCIHHNFSIRASLNPKSLSGPFRHACLTVSHLQASLCEPGQPPSSYTCQLTAFDALPLLSPPSSFKMFAVVVAFLLPALSAVLANPLPGPSDGHSIRINRHSSQHRRDASEGVFNATFAVRPAFLYGFHILVLIPIYTCRK